MAGVTVKAGERDVLNVLGMPLWFLCNAEDTAGAWSLMEEEIPEGLGPPPIEFMPARSPAGPEQT